ncbi:MAG: hypothetical protein JOZ99_05205 [Actinobacteria bacterium]|nr:hypothetical protein [Actinomycetota bacterium]
MKTVEMLVDERGDLLRASWHEGDAGVDLSLWRGSRCRATFRLTLDDAARLGRLLGDAIAGRALPPTAA